MFLSDKDIIKAVEEGRITISDFDEKRMNPVSYDILLGNNFILTDSNKTTFIDPHMGIQPQTQEIIVPDGESFILHPGLSLLGVSKDYFGSDEYMIYLSGKSSLARIGLLVHNTASIVNPGHYLRIAFELCNLNSVPIILRPGMKIAQILFANISCKPEIDYKDRGRYNDKNRKSFIQKRNNL